ncbi:protein kinase subdomain-containing protein PKL/CAK/ChoK [Macrolepiota fuliginosa MF-IS2]|uniref:Protein kinase subdomain-containing protein PKL/CAK/ChoK n=1 Tax=Macrolepiota fuliginosa MF-IS2 TaxID=1400762 RepID=A0A9P5XLD0_9AGAR|nr:protein kinase subdomain-containing protein PKL/CAK/ChoK [Macrolepiota fuliginosa MF-IS2]
MFPVFSSTISTSLSSPPPPASLKRQLSNVDTDTIEVEGLRHARIKLKARHYKTPEFASEVFEILRLLHVPYFHATDILPRDLTIRRVSGALTNAVFFVSFPSTKRTCTVLLRVYGPSSGSLISRPRELHALHILSSKYHIGPRIYGTFENGRIEEYFESTTLVAQDIRDPQISQWIGARMAEFHSVDIDVVEGESWELGATKNVRSWLAPARDILVLPSLPEDIKRELDLDDFCLAWDRYSRWLCKVDDVHSGSKRVFAHNDAQYGNLLRLKHPKEGANDHRQIIVVDFEYAAPNPASYDIANHFHEWTANYHSDKPHLLDASRYPTLDERRNFYLAYLRHTYFSTKEHQHIASSDAELESVIAKLDRQVQVWSPASHASWALWAIVQARDDLENDNRTPEFDYIGYARCRMAGFLRELKQLGVL